MRIGVYLMAIGAMASGALIGAILGIQISETSALPAGKAVEAGDLQLVLNSVERASRQCERDEASPMSSGRTEGASRDRLDRMYVRVTVKNRGDRAQYLEPEEFRLQTPNDGSRSSTRGSLAAATLRPREILNGVLLFDVPETAFGLQLVWTRDGREVRVPIGHDTSDRAHGDPDNFQHGGDEVASSAVPFPRDAKSEARGC